MTIPIRIDRVIGTQRPISQFTVLPKAACGTARTAKPGRRPSRFHYKGKMVTRGDVMTGRRHGDELSDTLVQSRFQ
jgi:hypothetical protein